MVSPYVGMQIFTRDLAIAGHDFANDEFKVLLTNVEPNPATDGVVGDLTEIAPQFGYVAGGAIALVTVNYAAGVTKMTGVTVVFTGAGGSFGPFQYAVLYNNTNVLKPLIAYWDYGSPLIVGDTETFTVVFDAVDGILSIAEAP